MIATYLAICPKDLLNNNNNWRSIPCPGDVPTTPLPNLTMILLGPSWINLRGDNNNTNPNDLIYISLRKIQTGKTRKGSNPRNILLLLSCHSSPNLLSLESSLFTFTKLLPCPVFPLKSALLFNSTFLRISLVCFCSYSSGHM